MWSYCSNRNNVNPLGITDRNIWIGSLKSNRLFIKFLQKTTNVKSNIYHTKNYTPCIISTVPKVNNKDGWLLAGWLTDWMDEQTKQHPGAKMLNTLYMYVSIYLCLYTFNTNTTDIPINLQTYIHMYINFHNNNHRLALSQSLNRVVWSHFRSNNNKNIYGKKCRYVSMYVMDESGCLYKILSSISICCV